jgi:hypothetical protein
MEDIINNNYSVIRLFDDRNDGYVKSNLSHKEAIDLKNKLQRNNRGYLKRYDIKLDVAIIGIVEFNKDFAYIFNYIPDSSNSTNKVVITCKTYEELMDCYVYASKYIDSDLFDKLNKEYTRRGGEVFKYHGYEDKILSPERKSRRREFRNNIVENIFKHGFKEVGKLKWSNGNITIKQSDISRMSINYESNVHPMDLNISINDRIMINSLFSPVCEYASRLSENTICVRTIDHNHRYKWKIHITAKLATEI